MFLQNCFIRIEHDFALINKVSEMGYQPLYLDCKYNLIGKNLVLEQGSWHYTDSDNHPDSIDCGTNKELFLGIAAMNDVKDKDQYFSCAEIPGKMILCTKNTLRSFFVYDEELDLCDESWSLYRKVTPKELVDHYRRFTISSNLIKD